MTTQKQTTTNTPWTPGPWHVDPLPYCDGGYYIQTTINGGLECVATTIDCSKPSDEQDLADAQLIALAPEMAEALAECITEEGAAAFLKREYAEKRLRYITEIARAILARLPQKGGEK